MIEVIFLALFLILFTYFAFKKTDTAPCGCITVMGYLLICGALLILATASG